MPKEDRGLKSLRAQRANFHLESDEAERLIRLYERINQRNYITVTAMFKELIGLIPYRVLTELDRRSLLEGNHPTIPITRPKIQVRDK